MAKKSQSTGSTANLPLVAAMAAVATALLSARKVATTEGDERAGKFIDRHAASVEKFAKKLPVLAERTAKREERSKAKAERKAARLQKLRAQIAKLQGNDA